MLQLVEIVHTFQMAFHIRKSGADLCIKLCIKYYITPQNYSEEPPVKGTAEDW